MEGCDFAVEGFECSRTGSARDIDGLSYGYTYRLSGTDRVAVVNTADYAAVSYTHLTLPTTSRV